MAEIAKQASELKFTYESINELCTAAAQANNAGSELILMYETADSVQFDNGKELHVWPKPAYYFK